MYGSTINTGTIKNVREIEVRSKFYQVLEFIRIILPNVYGIIRY